MIKKHTTEYGQNIADIALQYYGSVDGIIDLSKLNEISITEELLPGQVIDYDDENTTNYRIKKYYQDLEFVVNTGKELQKGEFNNDFNADFDNK